MWRNRKRNGVQLSVDKTVGKPTYLLTIEIEGETTTVDEFATPLWALEFGDWLWQELLHAKETPSVEFVAQKRQEWERTMAPALRGG